MKRLYVMKSNGAYKIGVSQNPKKRLQNLGIGNCDIKLIYESEMMCNAYAVESALHKKFCNYSVGREWFHIVDEGKLIEEVCAVVAEIGIFEPDKKQTTCGSESKMDKLMNSFFEPEKKAIRQINKEIEDIWKENELLAQRLIDLGWAKEDIDSLIEKAIESVQ